MKRPSEPIQEKTIAYADSNIALAKYWGKRDVHLHLPCNSSVSVTLPNYGTEMTLSVADHDQLYLNGAIAPDAEKRLFAWINRLTHKTRPPLHIHSKNTIPTAAGLASSASAFAAATRGLEQLFGWSLSDDERSQIARLGSGSACRSLFSGFAIWHKGESADGSDSVAQAIPIHWPDFCIGFSRLCDTPKPISSTEAMQRTVETSPQYAQWPAFAEKSAHLIYQAIQNKDFERLGMLAEENAKTMHATMRAATPSIDYALPATLKRLEQVHQLRTHGLMIFYTMDAGPNPKVLFLKKDMEQIQTQMPDLTIVEPFYV